MSSQFHINVPRMVLFQIPSIYDPQAENDPTPRKLFENFLLRNHQANFYQISQECSLGGLLSDSFKL